MGLFNKLFRPYDFESMDEMKQIELIDGLGISDLREDTESIKERIGLLEQNLDKLESSLHWRDNIITGDVALARVKEKEEASAPEELSRAFEEIRQAVDNEQTSVKLYEYEVDPDSWGIAYNRKYHLNNLIRLLPDYNYSIEMHEGDTSYYNHLLVSWDKSRGIPTSEIDPDKKYILPMDDATSFGGGTFYTFVNQDGWTIDIAPNNEDACNRGYLIKGGRLKDAPDWVKVIKPIEVKE